jgi:hypothetical protein
MAAKFQLEVFQVFCKNSFIFVSFLLPSLMLELMSLHRTFGYLHYFKKLFDHHLFFLLKKCIFVISPNRVSDEAYLAYWIYYYPR